MTADGTAVARRRRRVIRPWRWAFAGYAAVLTISTHWPQLELGPEVPASDKTLHLIAFAVATVLLWRTAWPARLWQASLIVLTWAVVDEITQGIPGLGRVVTWEDALASVLGVVVATASVWALGPIGGAINRRRLRRNRYAFDEAFARWRTWLALLGVFLACAVPLALAWRHLPRGSAVPMAIAIGVWLAASLAALFAMLRAEARDTTARRPCLECGAAAATDGIASCPVCGAGLHAGSWRDPPPPRGLTWLGLVGGPVAIGVVAVVATFVVLRFMAPLWSTLVLEEGAGPGVASLIAAVVRLPRSVHGAVDTAFVAIVLAGLGRLYRGRLAAYHDRWIRCRRCGHDLRATPLEGAVRRCGECGYAFHPEPGTPADD